VKTHSGPKAATTYPVCTLDNNSCASLSIPEQILEYLIDRHSTDLKLLGQLYFGGDLAAGPVYLLLNAIKDIALYLLIAWLVTYLLPRLLSKH